MKTIKYLILLFTSLTLSVADAQYSVKGVVTDKSSNQPIPGAVVSIPNTTTATSTDARGMFTLQSATDFDSIVVTSVGYSPMRMAVLNKSQSLNITLTVSSSPLSPVEILGARQAQGVTTLTSTDLNRASGLRLRDALNTVPGVQMESRSPWGGQHIIIRGYYPSDYGRTGSTENFSGYGYQLFIDNIPVTDATGTTVMDDIDFSNLGKVEIIKGPSALYGSYIAGAVNLYTPIPAPNQTSLQEQVVGGSYGLFRTNTSLMASDGKASIWVNYGQQTYNGFRPNDGSKKNFASFAGTFTTGKKNTVSTYFSYNNSTEQLAGELDSNQIYGRQAVSDTDYWFNYSHVQIESVRAGATNTHVFNSHFSNATTLFATGDASNQYFAHGYSYATNLNFGGRTSFNYTYTSNKLYVAGIVGSMFEKTNQNTQGNFVLPFKQQPSATSSFTANSPFSTPTDAQNYGMNYNTFTQWTFTLPTPQLSLTVGGSLNFFEIGIKNLIAQTGPNAGKIFLDNPTYVLAYKPVFTPDVCLTKSFTNNLSIYASMASGYAPPNIGQMTNSLGQVDVDLQPESATQYEVGSKGTVAHKLSYQVAVFDMNITNRLTQEVANSMSYWTNVGKEQNMGAELYLGYDIFNNQSSAITFLRPWVSYTYANYKYTTFQVFGQKGAGDTVTYSYNGNAVASVAPNVFNFGLDLDTKAGIYLHATYQYVDKVPITFDNEHYASAYSLLSARLGYKHQFGKHVWLDAYVGGDNLLSSTYYSEIFVGENINLLAQGNDMNYLNVAGKPAGGGDGYILPAPYNATFYGGLTFRYIF